MRWNDDRMEDAVKGNSSIRLFGSAMREAVDQLSQAVLGRPWDEHYRPPGAYTGEFLGIEYLYSQTGKTLTPMLQTPEEEDRLVESVSDKDLQDEGFEEDTVEDITVPVLCDPHHDAVTSPSSSAPPLLSASPDASSGQHLSSVPVSPSHTESSPCSEAELSLDLMGLLAGTKFRIWLLTLLDFVKLLISQSHK
ncbi:hypothetical protein OJAV_G00069920 [Oryzias javanicus]|uniref:Uncharacterized protein n=1 Tax=Oryzias javanicus TaxID=123683 RepID=A0A437D8Q4_ORYJA|nr:hypothetical protein OJAV_G00069920 [Oryzias javanicus]